MVKQLGANLFFVKSATIILLFITIPRSIFFIL